MYISGVYQDGNGYLRIVTDRGKLTVHVSHDVGGEWSGTLEELVDLLPLKVEDGQ
jgi:hypothetical protein